MPKPYPEEFRDDVVRVARARESGVTLAQIAKDFGIHEMTLSNWLRRADVEEGIKPGTTQGIDGTTDIRADGFAANLEVSDGPQHLVRSRQNVPSSDLGGQDVRKCPTALRQGDRR